MKGSFSQNAGKTKWTALLCLIYLFVSSLPLWAAPGNQEDLTFMPGRSEYPELMARVQAEGTVRVMVALKATGARSTEATLEAINAPKTALAIAQDSVLNSLQNYKEVKKFQFIPYMSLEVDAAGLTVLASSKQVAAIGRDKIFYPSLSESAAQIGVSKAWSMGGTGAGQTIAIIDTGVDKNHPFLRGKVVSEACFSTTYAPYSSTSLCPGGVGAFVGTDAGLHCSTTIQDCEHGTHVAGIAAGKGRSYSGVAKDASIIAIQAASKFNSDAICRDRQAPCALFYSSDVVSGLERVYTLQQTSGLRIAAVNFSGGSSAVYQPYCDNQDIDTQATRDAVEKLREIGVATIVAAGNNGSEDGLTDPACLSNVISVGSTGDGSMGSTRDAVSDYSNCATSTSGRATPSLMAPGEVILSSVPGVGFSYFLGTSMASPQVAGAWAILRAARPTATIDQIASTLDNTGYPVTDDKCSLTISQIQVDAALRSLLYEIPGSTTITTVVTTTVPTTTSYYPTTTNPNPGAPYIVATPSWCEIPAGQTVCSVSLQVYNPGNRLVQVWSRSPDFQESPVTGVFTTTYFGISAPWISVGNYTFNLYDVSGSSRILLSSAVVTGVSYSPSTSTPTTSSWMTTTSSWLTTTTAYVPTSTTTTLPASDLMLNISCPRAAPGTDVVVPVSLTTVVYGTGPVSLQGDLSYDPALMTYIGATSGPAAVSSFKEVGVGLQYPGRLRFLVSGQNQSVIGDGILVYLTFRVTTGLPSGTTLPMICSDTRAYNLFGQIINLGCASCSLPTQAAVKRIMR